ncbi:MAG: radical SAM protein [Chitinispirillaceae bacterium]|jgi:hypothetical protein
MSISKIPVLDSKYKRAAVIVPPFRDFYFTRHRFSSLGAHIVAKLLNRSGMQVELLNFPLMNKKGVQLEIPPELGYLKPFILPEETGKLSFFTAFRRFGPSPEQCVKMIEAVRPEICFLSVFAFCYADDAIELAEKIKMKMPAVPLIAGGAGVSAYPGYFLKKNGIDFTLSGEAEAGLPQFLSEILLPDPDFRKVPNCAWKDKNIVSVSPLHAFASDTEIEIALVKTAESSRRTTLSTSLVRGCPKQCDFCSSRLLFGDQIRTPLPERLEEALTDFSQHAGNDGMHVTINIEDDNLLCDETFLHSSIALFKKHLPGASFIAENGIDYSLLTPALCEWLLQNGMSKFNLSLASLAPEILAKEGRFLYLERYEKTIGFLASKHVPSVTYFICGLKNDALESTACNLVYLHNKQTVAGISIFYAVPGLPGFTDFSMFDNSPSFLCLGSVAYPWNKSLSTEAMITAFRLSRYSNLLKNSIRTDQENRLIKMIAEKKELHTIVKNKSGNETIMPVPNQDKELVKLFFKKLN